jgi:chemotaxis protein MotB
MSRRKRRHGEGAHENEERWLLTYADMITLLMALFIVMYAISNTDIRKLTVLAQSLSAAFNADVMTGQQAISINDGQDTTLQEAQSASGASPVQSDLKAIQAALEDYAIGVGLGGEVEVGMAPQGIVIRLNDAMLFSSGRAHLDAHALNLVDRVVGIIGPLPNKIRIEGNTDDQAPDGVLYSSNWDLSTDRALSVLKAMIEDGMDPGRLTAQGNAQYNPLAENKDDASRAKNRRVDIVVIYAGDSPVPVDPVAVPSFLE